MAPDRRDRRARRAAGWFAFACVLLALTGCRFLADEFTWLDRLPPGALEASDAPPSALDDRP